MPTKTTTTKTTTRRPSSRPAKMNDVMTTSNGSVTREMIARRAFELFVERGGKHGYHVEDWLRAERELIMSSSSSSS